VGFLGAISLVMMMTKAGNPAATINNSPTNNQLSSIYAPKRRIYPAFLPRISTFQYFSGTKNSFGPTIKPNGTILP
jgi:hypothetical protein